MRKAGVMIVISVVLLLLTFIGASAQEASLETIEAKLDVADTYKADVSNLATSTDVFGLSDQLIGLASQSSVDAIEVKLDNLEFPTIPDYSTDLETIEGKLDLLDIIVPDYSTELTAIEAKLDNAAQYQANVEGLASSSAVDALETKMDSMTSVLGGYDTSFTDLDLLLNDVDVAVAAIEAKLDALTSAKDGHFEEVLDDLTALEAKLDVGIPDIMASLEGLGGDVAALESKLDTTMTNIDNVRSAIDALEAKMDTLSTDLAAVEAKLDVIDAKIDNIDNMIATQVIPTLNLIDFNLINVWTLVTGIDVSLFVLHDNVDSVEAKLDTMAISDAIFQDSVNGEGGAFSLVLARLEEINTNIEDKIGDNELALEALEAKMDTLASALCGGPSCLINLSGCVWNNPACVEGFQCVQNRCVLKEGCEYSNPPCRDGYKCKNNVCERDIQRYRGIVTCTNVCGITASVCYC